MIEAEEVKVWHQTSDQRKSLLNHLKHSHRRTNQSLQANNAIRQSCPVTKVRPQRVSLWRELDLFVAWWLVVMITVKNLMVAMTALSSRINTWSRGKWVKSVTYWVPLCPYITICDYDEFRRGMVVASFIFLILALVSLSVNINQLMMQIFWKKTNISFNQVESIIHHTLGCLHF